MSERNATSLNFLALDGLKRANVLSSAYLAYGFLVFIVIGLISFIVRHPVFISAMLLIGLAFVVRAYLQNKRALENNQNVFREFAVANNMIYTPVLSGDLKVAPGTLFMHGHSKKGSSAFTGKLGEWPLTVFRYDYATGSGKSRRSYDATVVEVELPRNMPHMVIDSLAEEGLGYGSVLPIEFDKSQKIDLEGDFYKYFALYAPDKYGISALTVIAPDAMQALMEHAALCDIEIIDNKLYFYWPEVAATRRQYEQVFGTVDAILKEIGNKLSRGDIFATAEQAKVHSVSNTQGARLKKQRLTLATVFMVSLYISSQVVGEMDNPPPILIAVVGVALLLFAAHQLRRYHARRRLLADLQNRFTNYRRA